MRLALALAGFLIAASVAAAGPTGVSAPLPDGLRELAEAAVRETLGAPQTARFRRIEGYQLSDGGWAVCGQVNSRNFTSLRMGWKPIFLRFQVENGGYSLIRRIVDWPADVACRHLDMGWPLRTRN